MNGGISFCVKFLSLKLTGSLLSAKNLLTINKHKPLYASNTHIHIFLSQSWKHSYKPQAFRSNLINNPLQHFLQKVNRRRSKCVWIGWAAADGSGLFSHTEPVEIVCLIASSHPV